MRVTTLAALGAVLGAAWWASRQRAGAGVAFNSELIGALDSMGLDASFGFIKVANMGAVDRALIDHPNVQAMLRVIRQGESNQNASAYRLIVGGKTFTSFEDHPRIAGKCWTVGGKKQCSTAAGAYQITATSWDETRAKMGLGDFSPRNQDLAALGRIAYRGALPAVLAGDVVTAVKRLRMEWTSLPGAAENNRLAGDLDNARRLFVAWGGDESGALA